MDAAAKSIQGRITNERNKIQRLYKLWTTGLSEETGRVKERGKIK